MGKVSSIKALSDQKVQITLEVSQAEALWLRGNMEHIHIFSERNLDCDAKLIKRGKKESTKYFLLPRELRKGVMASPDVKCTRIETKTKNLFIFSVPKF